MDLNFSLTEMKNFKRLSPDFLSRGEDNRIVADTKYIPLDGTKNLSADRAAAIYYKTIMYMYRFNSNKGLLLYPSKDDNTSYPKDFRIIETNGSLVKIPMKISTKKDFWEFAEDMKHNEKEFLIAIKKIKA